MTGTAFAPSRLPYDEIRRLTNDELEEAFTISALCVIELNDKLLTIKTAEARKVARKARTYALQNAVRFNNILVSRGLG